MARIMRWLKDSISNRRSGAQRQRLSISGPDMKPMPFLPAQRPRALSLLPSTSQTCAFFAKLPLELRQEIYDLAFCHRTIHIELLHLSANEEGNGHTNRRGGAENVSLADSWRWWSYICHRYRTSSDGREMVRDFWLDDCRNEETKYRHQEGLVPRECYIGVMGWLQSCRQAYSEIIARLYERNTFFIGQWHNVSEEVFEFSQFRHLSRLLLPQKLASISRLELSFNVVGLDRHETPVFPGLLDILITNFPNLRSLKLALIIRSFGRDVEPGDERACLLDPLDGLARRYGKQLELLEFATASPYYENILEVLRDDEIPQSVDDGANQLKFYRWVDSAAKVGYWVISFDYSLRRTS